MNSVTTPGNGGWIGVDLDGTLAHYEGWNGSEHVGDPVPAMLARVRMHLSEGWEVRIFTARVYPLNRVYYPNDPVIIDAHDPRQRDCQRAIHAIREWCGKHLGRVLAVTNVKDYSMVRLYDDRCVQVIENTGELVERLSQEEVR